MVTLKEYERAVAALDMPLQRYLLIMVIPLSITSLIVAVFMILVLPATFSGLFIFIPIAIPLITIPGVIMYPMSVAQSKGHHINHNMHYFISHLGVLATSGEPPVQLFETIGNKEKEYGPLAEECEKVASLVKDWHMGLSDACRFTAKRTPSEIFSDFLERVAFGLESGAEMEEYLVNEQEVVMAEYENMYRSTLNRIEEIKGLFNGLMMSVIFLIMFMILMAVLVGIPTTWMMGGILGLVIMVEGGFIFLVKARIPPDQVWANSGIEEILWPRLRFVLPLALLGGFLLGLTLYLFTTWHLAIVTALAASPLIVPGYLANKEETQIKRRDDNFPAFIRSMGASTAARGGDERAVLRHLRHHDFGPLTDTIRGLYTRLQLRIDDEMAWELFTTEAGSTLIDRFTQMYDEAVEAGGSPQRIGHLISTNMVRIIGLRKLRYELSGGFRGTMFGIAVGASFALFIGVGVIDMLSGLFSQFSEIGADSATGAGVAVPSLISISGVNIPLMETLAIVVLLVNAAMSAVMTRMADGGTLQRSYQDFTMLVWVSNAVALGSAWVMTSFLGASFST